MTYADLLSSFTNLKALVLGDLMLDEYIFGRATRISPEAPVMVIRQSRTTAVPGGGANVAKNLVAMGAQTVVIGVVGQDDAGQTLEQSMQAAGLCTDLIVDPDRPTTRKTRVLADSAHQVLRIDHEDHAPVSYDVAAKVLVAAEKALVDCDVVLLSDYVKGVLTGGVVSRVIELARAKGIPVIANAKPSSLPYYRGASLVSLNRVEAAGATGWPELREEFELSTKSEAPMRAAAHLREQFALGHVLITLGGDGMCTEDLWVAPRKVEVFDTAGAGDTTIATVALGLASVGYREEVFSLASQTAGAIVQKVGVAVPSADDLALIAKG